MSVISNRHQFVQFFATGSEKSKPFAGQRLCKVIFKSRNGSPATMPSQCVSVPPIEQQAVTNNLPALMPHLVAMLENVQDAIAREVLLAGSSDLTDEQISVTACVQYLDAQSRGDRISGDDIKAWFADALEPMLMVAFADKLQIPDQPTEEQAAQLQRMCNVYRDKLAALAGGRTAYDKITCQKLLKALELVDSDDAMGSKLQVKLNAMQSVSVEELLGL